LGTIHGLNYKVEDIMKKQFAIATLAASSLFLGGCATSFPAGGLLTDVSLPAGATSAANAGAKKGVATCNSYLALVAVGDCTVETAKKNGGITEVTHMDWKANNILGIIGTYTLTVYGK
jgi:hypothetical protein